MAHIIETLNPFEPLTQVIKHQHAGGITIRQWLQETHPGFQEFSTPTICLVNGQPKLRKEWDVCVIKENDIINFIAVVGETFIFIAAIVVELAMAAWSVYSILSMKQPGALPASQPVYTLKGQQNQTRLDEPIEVNYGKNRIYPSYASQPYYRYINNVQYQYSLFCIGQGYHEINQILIGDSDVGNFPNVQYEVVLPGSKVTLFPTNIYVSAEVGNQHLFGPNESQYVSPGYVGPFVASPTGTQVSHIAIDLTYPKGIYSISGNGNVGSETIDVIIDASLIDDTGTQIGDWFTIISSYYTASTTTPQRITLEADVPIGRYQVRARRTNNTDLNTNAANDVYWDGMQAYKNGDSPDFGSVTILAIIAQASNSLNSNTQVQFNVICTRMLPARGFTELPSETPSGYGEDSYAEPLYATRSIVWAFVDVFMASYGANITDMSYFDWDALNALDALYTSRGEHFDFTFRDPIAVWDAATTIGVVGRATPVVVGSLITLIRDGPISLPVTMFTPQNIVKDSFQWDITLWNPYDYDSLEVAYVDSATGYIQQTVVGTLPGGTENYPNQLTLNGCTDRQKAYSLGLYLEAKRLYLRETISFITGLEGFIPSFGDLIMISHDAPQWGQSGYVVAVDALSNGNYILLLSEPPRFQESGQIYQIYLRGKSGSAYGPYDAQPTTDPMQVELLVSSEMDFLADGTTEPMLFLFGIKNSVTKLAKVTRIEPQGGEQIKITCVNYDETVYSFDGIVAPAIGNPASYFPQPPSDYIISYLHLGTVPFSGPGGGIWLQYVNATWASISVASYYVIQSSLDGVTWGNTMTSQVASARVFVTSVYSAYVRVAVVVSTGQQGPWIEASLNVGSVANLTEVGTWTGLSWEVTWPYDSSVLKYQIEVYDNTDPGGSSGPYRTITQSSTTPSNTYSYNYTDAVADGLVVRNMKVAVDTMWWNTSTNDYESSGNPTYLDLSNPTPVAPTSLAAAYVETGSDGNSDRFHFTWTNPTDADLVRVKVWVSTTNNFNASTTSPVYDYTAGTPGYTNVPQELYYDLEYVGGVRPTYYWRVAVFDVWGNELTTGLSSQQTI